MIGAWRRRVVVALVVLGTVVAVMFLLRFPWGGAADAVRRADGWILLAAGIVNVASFAAKGLEWQLLLGHPGGDPSGRCGRRRLLLARRGGGENPSCGDA